MRLLYGIRIHYLTYLLFKNLFTATWSVVTMEIDYYLISLFFSSKKAVKLGPY